MGNDNCMGLSAAHDPALDTMHYPSLLLAAQLRNTQAMAITSFQMSAFQLAYSCKIGNCRDYSAALVSYVLHDA